MTRAARRARLERALDWTLLVGLGAIPLTVAWTVAGAHLAIGLAALAALVRGAVTGRWAVRRTPADLAMLAFAAACGLATLWSVDRAQSFMGLKKLLLLPVVHVVAAGFAGRRRSRAALRLFIVGVGGTALLAILHFLLFPHATDARLRSTGHYMTFAGLVLLALPLCMAAAATVRGRMRLAYAGAVAILGLALALGFTRGAWIGLVVGSIAMLLRARPKLAWVVPAAVALALLVMPGTYRERALSSFDPSHPFNLDRLRLWRAGVAIWRDHPWSGVGLVDLKPLYLQYRDSTQGQVHGHLHDNWIQIAATLGTLGLLAFAWLMASFGRIAWLAAAPPGTELRGLALGLWGAFWGFQVMGLFEWNFGDVEVTIALYYLLGAGIAVGACPEVAGRDPSPPVGAAGPPGREGDS